VEVFQQQNDKILVLDMQMELFQPQVVEEVTEDKLVIQQQLNKAVLVEAAEKVTKVVTLQLKEMTVPQAKVVVAVLEEQEVMFQDLVVQVLPKETLTEQEFQLMLAAADQVVTSETQVEEILQVAVVQVVIDQVDQEMLDQQIPVVAAAEAVLTAEDPAEAADQEELFSELMEVRLQLLQELIQHQQNQMVIKLQSLLFQERYR